jgi:hypothetical protein
MRQKRAFTSRPGGAKNTAWLPAYSAVIGIPNGAPTRQPDDFGRAHSRAVSGFPPAQTANAPLTAVSWPRSRGRLMPVAHEFTERHHRWVARSTPGFCCEC